MAHQLDANNSKIEAFNKFSQSFERMNFDSFRKQTDQLKNRLCQMGTVKTISTTKV